MNENQEKLCAGNARRRILVADGDQTRREALEGILNEDWEILSAGDGREALRLLRDNADMLSLALLDWMLPAMDGRALLQRIRDDSALRHIPVVALTEAPAAEAESLTLGAVDAISRPWPAHEVVRARIRHAVGCAAGLKDRVCAEDALCRVDESLCIGLQRVYDVNAETGRYEMWSARQLRTGDDFFADVPGEIDRDAYAPDRERLRRCLTREALLARLDEKPRFTLAFRRMIGGTPVYHSLRAVATEGPNGRRIVIGISNMDAELAEFQHLEAERQGGIPFSRIAQALSQDFFCIYSVNTQTDQYIEYSASDLYRELAIDTCGENFFERSRVNVRRVVHPEDQELVLSALKKEVVLAALRQRGFFTLTYRLMFSSGPTYVHLKVTPMEDRSDPHIVIGISNVDPQMRRERQYAQELRQAREQALKDALTGVKSKHAFLEAEEVINARLASGDRSPFAMAVCDVNDLKQVNDTQGHVAGDQIIRAACSVICNTFKHSPVYRIGGDEFVVILRGQDYENRKALADKLAEYNLSCREHGGVVIACGMSEMTPSGDQDCKAVFQRADAAMYEDKRRLKDIL